MSLVYIEPITRTVEIDRRTAIEVLTLLVKEEILRPVYKIYCPYCEESSKEIYSNINEALEYGICHICGENICKTHHLSAIDFLFQK